MERIRIEDLPIDDHKNRFFHFRQLTQYCTITKAFEFGPGRWAVTIKPIRRKRGLRAGWVVYDEHKGYFDTTKQGAVNQYLDYY